MVTFTHDAAGTAEAAWLSWGGLESAPPLPALPGRAVVVAAHPDDETLGAGGLMAHLGEAGVELHVVVATAGEASHPFSPTLTGAQLARLRSGEVRAAVAAVHPAATVHELGLPDGRLRDHAAELRGVVGELAGPGTWVVAPWRGDAHPDHEAAGDAAAGAASEWGSALLEYPIWAWHWAAPGDARLPWPDMRRLSLTGAQRERKRAAMAAHHTQTLPLSDAPGDEALLSDAVLAHFERWTEHFVLTPALDGSALDGSVLDGSVAR